MNWDDIDIPPFEVDQITSPAFPAGSYIGALGKIIPIFGDDDIPGKDAPIAVHNEIWVLKYLGVNGEVSETRITITDGNVIMSDRGVKIVERYPHPSRMPKLKWRASAFFSKFECIDEIGEPPVKVVNWNKVREKYGTIFHFTVSYSGGKDGKRYRNVRDVEVTSSRITVDDMKKIEQHYELIRADKEENKKVDQDDDFPF